MRLAHAIYACSCRRLLSDHWSRQAYVALQKKCMNFELYSHWLTSRGVSGFWRVAWHSNCASFRSNFSRRLVALYHWPCSHHYVAHHSLQVCQCHHSFYRIGGLGNDTALFIDNKNCMICHLYSACYARVRCPILLLQLQASNKSTCVQIAWTQ
jgi:hypothetical protein